MRRLRIGLIGIVIGGLLAAHPIAAHAETTIPTRAEPAPSAEERLKADRDRTLPAGTPERDGSAPLLRPEPSRLPATRAAGSCDTVRKNLRKYRGEGRVACVEPADLARPDARRAAALDVIELPEFCADNAFTSWVFYRTQACGIFARTVVVLDLRTGAPVGALEFLEINFSYTSTSIETWAQQIEIRPYGGWGAGLLPGTMVEGIGTCTKSCWPASSDFPPQLVRQGADAEGEAFFDTTAVTKGMVGDAFTKFTYTFTNPGWASPSTPLTSTPPKVRCDNALPGNNTPIGCVFPDFTPIMQYAKAGTYPELARHVADAQASGLPGAYPDGPPLTRLVDRAEQDKNRNKACPRQDRGGYPRPATKSCDEYPMASTRQGANQAPVGVARSHDWCQVAEPTGSGPVGYSVCMIDAWQNSEGGRALNDYFFTRERVIDEDPFYVWITGTDTGPNPNPPDYPPTANAGPDVSGDEGSPITLSGSATDDNGAPQTAWSWRPGAGVDAGATCRFDDPAQAATTITCTDDGTYHVTLEADDGIHDQPASDGATVTVRNVRPRVRSTGPNLVRSAAAAGELGVVSPRPWQLFRVGDPVSLRTGFTDPGANDTHTCTVRWDDGSAVESFPAADGACARSHTFTKAGMYTITPGITDDDGDSAEALRVMVVVYDPAAGVGRGNGWLSGPSDGGFDFTASYPTRAATVPDGAVTFAMPPGTDLNLRNHQRLEWLVVTPDGKIAIKGTAERVPGQNVGFVLYGYYGCPAGQTTGCQPGPHRLRMVVWDSTAHGPIPEGVPAMYDNRAGRSFDVDEADPQSIHQGQVLIQHPPIG